MALSGIALGAVSRLKCDNAAVTEPAQFELAGEALRRGRLFLHNGAPCVRSVQRLPVLSFVEGGNGYGTMSSQHLARVPLVLGNFGDETTRAGVFAKDTVVSAEAATPLRLEVPEGGLVIAEVL